MTDGIFPTYENIFHRRLTVNVGYSKIPKRLPEFLSKEEIKRLFEAITNQKHQLMIKLLYATGMRVSELVSLRVRDFDFEHNFGWIRNGKGGKDRLFIISLKLKEELQRWTETNRFSPNNWFFKGQGNHHISPKTIQLIIKKAAKSAQISKNVHPHTLRHSFATHLIENGHAVTDVQPLLGHASMATTMVYLHMASPQLVKVKSPYDYLY